MTDDPYSFEPLPTAANPSLPPPLPPRVSKRQERVWMVCFWLAFIWALLQFAIGYAATHARPLTPADDEPLTNIMTWIWGQGMAADLFLAGASSLVAAFAFARARAGLSCKVPIVVWLALRIPVLIVLVISFLLLKQIDSQTYYYARDRLPWELLPVRVLLFDLPVWIFLFCAGLIWLTQREPPLRTQPAEPFSPWP